MKNIESLTIPVRVCVERVLTKKNTIKKRVYENQQIALIFCVYMCVWVLLYLLDCLLNLCKIYLYSVLRAFGIFLNKHFIKFYFNSIVELNKYLK